MTDADKLRRYAVVESLGSGGQGHTFRALDRDSGREVALKVVRLRTMDGWKAFDLFEREIAVLKGLHHPGIPAYLDDFANESTGEYFLVMELVPGHSLREPLAAGRPMAPEQLRAVLDGVLEVLAYLHGRVPPVIHRDVKPANIIVGAQGRISLVDFGGVRSRAGDGGSTMVGTFGYMAPEQLHGEASPATDVYALGATVVALATGREADRLPRRGLAIDVETLLPSSSLRDVLGRMVEPDPARRLATAAAVRLALDAADHGAPRDPGPDREVGSTALDVTSAIGRLAALPRPFSYAIWVWALLIAGALALIQVVVLPIVASARAGKGPHDHARLREIRRAVRHHRRALAQLAERTSPFGTEHKQLPGD